MYWDVTCCSTTQPSPPSTPRGDPVGFSEMPIDLYQTTRYHGATGASLRHKTGNPGFDSRWGPLNPFHCPNPSSPGVHTASDRNEHQGISFGG